MTSTEELPKRFREIQGRRMAHVEREAGGSQNSQLAEPIYAGCGTMELRQLPLELADLQAEGAADSERSLRGLKCSSSATATKSGRCRSSIGPTTGVNRLGKL